MFNLFDSDIDIKNALFPSLSTFLAHLLAMVILITVIVYLVWKPYKNFLKARHDHIASDIEKAENMRLNAEMMTNNAVNKMRELEKISADIKLESRQAAEKEKNQIVSAAHQEAKLLREKTQLEIKTLQENSQKEIQNLAIGIGVELAQKLINEKYNEKKDKELINEFISNLEKETFK